MKICSAHKPQINNKYLDKSGVSFSIQNMQRRMPSSIVTTMSTVMTTFFLFSANAGDAVIDINADGTTNELPAFNKPVKKTNSVVAQYNENIAAKISDQWYTLLDKSRA